MYTPLSFLNDQALLHEIWTCSSKVRLKRYESFVSKCAEHPIHLSDAYAKNAFCYQPWGFFCKGPSPSPIFSQSKVWEWLDGAVDSTSTTYRSKLEKESVPSVGEEHLWSLGLNISFHVCHLIIVPEFDCCAWVSWEDSWEDTSPLRGV